MEKNKLGEIIQFCRKKQKISQKDLCRGLCSVSTLFRIENDEIDKGILLIQALTERLGIDSRRFEFFLDDTDYKSFMQRRKIKIALRNKDILLSEKEIRYYEKIMERERLDLQYIKLQRAKLVILKLRKLEDSEDRGTAMALEKQAKQFLEEAETLTMLNKPREGVILLSMTELEILLTKVREHSLEKLTYVESFINKHDSLELKIKVYPFIQIERAKLLMEQGHIEDALAALEQGIAMSEKGMSYQYCADLQFLYAQVLKMRWEGTENWDEMRKACLKHCRHAYYLYQFDRDKRKAEVEKWESTV